MLRNSVGLAFAYFRHWLRKEDLYSQQSPFIFSRYQDLIHYLKSPEFFHLKATDFSATIFSNPVEKKVISTERFGSNLHPTLENSWKPRKKAAMLCSYFCQTTAERDLELLLGFWIR
jgi:hypothetical protein